VFLVSGQDKRNPGKDGAEKPKFLERDWYLANMKWMENTKIKLLIRD
jgi:hypothetical protein